MARFDRYAPGQFSWVDLLAPDLEAAAKFYGAVFGWTAEATQEDGGARYVMLRKGGVDVAGMGAPTDEMKAAGVPPHWSSYVSVADADATEARARELGARIQLPVLDIQTDGQLLGRMAVLVDPGGAHLSVWQPGLHAGSGLANVPGSFCWNELCTRDVEGAVAFYEALFGWKIGPGDDENGYRTIEQGGRLNGGILPWRPEMGDVPPSWSVYFAVEDCDASVARIQELGGQLYMGPVDIEPGRFAVVADPQGAVFNVMHVDNPDD